VTTAVSITIAARPEIIEAIDWYNARTPGLGGSFEAEVDRQLGRISENPLQFPLVVENIRRARLRRFPYGLFFQLRPKGVLITACFHARRDPRRWADRN
jgi:plasmid stabilization system protein ParE